MMGIWTNLTWPDDPYRTGQQLYPRPAPTLAAFAAGGHPAPSACAVVYLPLHRTKMMSVTEQTLTFGFHPLLDDLRQALDRISGRAAPAH